MSKAEEPTTALPGPIVDGAAADHTERNRTALPPNPALPEAAAHENHCEPNLLSLLVCPCTRTSLGYDSARQELISRPQRLAFPVRDGIPILVREEARSLDDGA